MTNDMFDYMSRVIALCNASYRFPIKEVSAGEDISRLMKAKSRGWIVMQSYDSYVTRAGWDAYLSEKDNRDHRAEKTANESKRNVKSQILAVAVPVIGATLAAIAGAVVSHWLQ